jgi:chemotaxis-related protein WspD
MEPPENNEIRPETASGLEEPAAGFQIVAGSEIEDCWRKIGVHGDSSCRELAKFVHCRNCPVYASAAGRMLERRLPVGYQKQWTEHFAKARESAAPGSMSLVIFRIDRDWLALPTGVFLEISECRPVHSLPHRKRSQLLGVVNVRGELLVCVSLAGLLGMNEDAPRISEFRARNRLAVAQWEGKLLTFPVSEVHGTHRCQPSELREPPSTVVGAARNFIRNMLPWEKRLVACLDARLVFAALNRSLA